MAGARTISSKTSLFEFQRSCGQLSFVSELSGSLESDLYSLVLIPWLFQGPSALTWRQEPRSGITSVALRSFECKSRISSRCPGTADGETESWEKGSMPNPVCQCHVHSEVRRGRDQVSLASQPSSQPGSSCPALSSCSCPDGCGGGMAGTGQGDV